MTCWWADKSQALILTYFDADVHLPTLVNLFWIYVWFYYSQLRSNDSLTYQMWINFILTDSSFYKFIIITLSSLSVLNTYYWTITCSLFLDSLFTSNFVQSTLIKVKSKNCILNNFFSKFTEQLRILYHGIPMNLQSSRSQYLYLN